MGHICAQRANTTNTPFLLQMFTVHLLTIILHILPNAGARASLPRSIACPRSFQLWLSPPLPQFEVVLLGLNCVA